MPRHQSAKKRTSARATRAQRRSASATLSEPELFIAPLTGPTVVEIVEARMKEGFGLISKALDEHFAQVLQTPVETSIRQENQMLGKMLESPPPVGGTILPDVKPVLLHDSHRVELESLFGGEPINTPDDVIRLSRRLSTVTLLTPDGKEVCNTTIPLDYLERLDSRRPIDMTLKEMVERGFFDYLEGVINGVYQ